MFDNENNNPTIGLYQASVWVDNVVQLFQSKNVPMVFDLLSVDTNFNDFWNLRAIMLGGYRPRVVIVEVCLFHRAETAAHHMCGVFGSRVTTRGNVKCAW
jgi:hypothetical protein